MALYNTRIQYIKMFSNIRIFDWPIVRGRSADLFCIWEVYAYVRKGSSPKRLPVPTKLNCLLESLTQRKFCCRFLWLWFWSHSLNFQPKRCFHKVFHFKAVILRRPGQKQALTRGPEASLACPAKPGANLWSPVQIGRPRWLQSLVWLYSPTWAT